MFSIHDFLKKYGKQTTSNIQLLNWAKQLKIKPFKTIMRNEIKNVKPNEYVIANIQKSSEEGVHWVCFHNNIYFDSYGLPPLEEYKELVKHGLYSEFEIQDFGQSFCGQLSLYVLYVLFHSDDKEQKFKDLVLDLYQCLARKQKF